MQIEKKKFSYKAKHDEKDVYVDPADYYSKHD